MPEKGSTIASRWPRPADDFKHLGVNEVVPWPRRVAAAVAALAKAIELDPAYRDKAKSDSHYDPIRDDAAFRKLVYGE